MMRFVALNLDEVDAIDTALEEYSGLHEKLLTLYEYKGNDPALLSAKSASEKVNSLREALLFDQPDSLWTVLKCWWNCRRKSN